MIKKYKEKKILIVGLGLIGGSYAKCLSSKGYKLYGIDNNPKTIDYATINKFINNESKSNEELIKNSDLIIVCLYPMDTICWIKENCHLFKEGAIITDTTGVKTSVINALSDIKTNGEFLSHHPMAGKESSGILNATADLFVGANFIVTPTLSSSPYAIEVIKSLGVELGFTNIEVLTKEAHDEIIGYLSQLTHVIAVSLMTARQTNHFVKFTGDSFRDLTRIAKINENLWSELFLMNKDVLVNEIDVFIESLDKVKSSLLSEDKETLKSILKQSTIARHEFDK